MTVKDYKRIADIIRTVKEDDNINQKKNVIAFIVGRLCGDFSVDNPRFDSDTFKVACGYHIIKETKDNG